MMRCNICTAIVPESILNEHASGSHNGQAVYTSLELDTAPPLPAGVLLKRQSCSVGDMREQLAHAISKFNDDREVSFKFEASIYPRPHIVYGSLARPEND